MTRFIFAFFLAIITIQLNAQQVTRQKVIVEVGTGTWCPSCPAVVAIIHDLENAGANIAVVEYHNNDPYANSEAGIRENYYNVSWWPTTLYDANLISINDWATYSVHLSYYEDRNNLLSSFQVSVDGDLTGLEVDGTITVEEVDEYVGSNLVLHIALTESNIPENWQGETELDYVERLMFPDGNGTPLDFSGGDIQDVNFNFNLDPTWVSDNCELIYFVQDNDTKEILQGDKITIPDFASLSIGDETFIDKTIIYPNPVIDNLSIQSTDNSLIKDIQISDITGRIIFSQENYSTSINLKEFSQGVYTLTYIESGNKKSKKIIKK